MDSYSCLKDAFSEFKIRGGVLAGSPSLLQEMVKCHGMAMSARLKAIHDSVQACKGYKSETITVSEVRTWSKSACGKTHYLATEELRNVCS